MKNSTKNTVEGKLHQAKGTVKETVGKVIGNPTLEMEGRDENVEGKVQQAIGSVEKVIGK